MAILRLFFLGWHYSIFQLHEATTIWKALFIGLRFDARIAALCSLPGAIYFLIPIARRLAPVFLWTTLVCWYAAIAVCIGLCCYFLPDIYQQYQTQGLSIIAGYKELSLAVLLVFVYATLVCCKKKWREWTLSFIRWLTSIHTFPYLILLCTYLIDANNYAYLQQRLGFGTLELLDERLDAFLMVWQTYPVFLSTAYVFGGAWIMGSISKRFTARPSVSIPIKHQLVPGLLCFIIFALMIMGQLHTSLFPLRWSQAHFTIFPEITALGTNPLQNLWDTKPTKGGERYDLAMARKGFPIVARALGVPYKEGSMRLDRTIASAPTPFSSPPNVVLIVMESWSHHKSSFFTQSINPTPFTKKLAESSVYFPNYFATARTTAKAMYSILTGIPDVNNTMSTSSRDMHAVDQFLILDQFAGYSKFYCIGGDANWANIRGLISSNIQGVRIMEQKDWKASAMDVWGVSDLDLLLESHELLAQQNEPFLAVIQTASFHRPFTVPNQSKTPGFDRTIPPQELLEQYGFVPDEFLSMRFADYALEEFFKKAQSSPYYANTIFAVVGDHGISEHSPAADSTYQALKLHGYHVPCLIHAPALFPEPRVVSTAAGHIDIIPTLASLAGISYHNTTLGTNVLAPDVDPERFTFIRLGSLPALVSKDLVVSCADTKEHSGVIPTTIYKKDGIACAPDPNYPEQLTNRDGELAASFYAVAQYLLYHNTKEAAKAAQK